MAFSMFPSTAMLLAVSGFAVAYVVIWRALTNPLRHIPGPMHTRITNLRLKCANLSGEKMYYTDALHAKYGPVVRISPTYVAFSSLSAVRQIYSSTAGFDKDKWYAEFDRVKGSGAVFTTTNNKEAGQRRRLISPPFSNSALHNNWELIVRDYVQLAVDQITAEAQRTGTTDIAKWWTLLANDVSARVMFGEKLGQLEVGEKTQYIRDMESFMMASGLTSELPLVGLVGRWLPFKTIFDHKETQYIMGQRVVRNAREGGTKANIFTGLIKKIGDQEQDDSGSISEFSVVIEASNLLVAASDTTSHVLTYLVWSVLKQPPIQQELENELATLPADFKDSHLEKLSILNAVINETLRLFGGANAAWPREVPAAGAVIDGYTIPGRSTVSGQSYTLHRKTDVFPDPLKFDYTRFLRPQTEDQRFAFAAWGRGARSCVGQHMAWMELRYATAMFFLAELKKDSRRKLRVAPSTTEATMRQADFFTTPPVSHKCELAMER